MEKTTYYQLNKPEVPDPLRVADFNENADIIDGVLKNQTDSLAALNTAVAAAGNCKIAMGSYVGSGTHGANNPNTLVFEFTPKLVFVRADANLKQGASLISSCSIAYTDVNDGVINVSWDRNGVSWHAENQYYQLNQTGYTYYYAAVG